MDSFMQRDEAAKERVRLAEEFLDPRKYTRMWSRYDQVRHSLHSANTGYPLA
jgi:hypothetical protein